MRGLFYFFFGGGGGGEISFLEEVGEICLWGEVHSPQFRVQGSVQLLRCAYNTPICGFHCLLCMVLYPRQNSTSSLHFMFAVRDATLKFHNGRLQFHDTKFDFFCSNSSSHFTFVVRDSTIEFHNATLYKFHDTKLVVFNETL